MPKVRKKLHGVRAARRVLLIAYCAACVIMLKSKRMVMMSEVIVKRALDFLNVDSQGFDVMDRKLLLALMEKFNGGPVGLGEFRGFYQ